MEEDDKGFESGSFTRNLGGGKMKVKKTTKRTEKLKKGRSAISGRYIGLDRAKKDPKHTIIESSD